MIRSYHASCLSTLETTVTVGLSAIQIYGFTYFILPQYSPPRRATSVRRNFAEVRKWTLKRGCHYPQRHQHQYLSGRYWWLIGCSHATTTLDTVEDCCRSLSECHGTSRRFLGASKLFCHRWLTHLDYTDYTSECSRWESWTYKTRANATGVSTESTMEKTQEFVPMLAICLLSVNIRGLFLHPTECREILNSLKTE